MDARFFYGNLFYSGTILNISEKGMFINTKRFFPSESMLVVLMRVDTSLLKVIARVKRMVKSNLDDEGIGVELLSPSAAYREFVHGLK